MAKAFIRKQLPAGNQVNSDIRLSIGFFDHPKTVKLKRKLGLEGVEALLRLWMYAAQYRPGGTFTNMDLDDIEIAVRWAGQAGELVKTLLEVRFLERAGDLYRLHDWIDHNGYASGAEDRSDKARFARLAKLRPDIFRQLKQDGVDSITAEEYRKLTTVERPLNDPLTEATSERSTPSPSPSPSPLPSKKEIKTPREKPRGSNSPDHQWFTQWWIFAFKRHTGGSFVYQKKHAGIISGLLKSLGLVELIRRACFYLCIPDERRFPRGSPTLEGLLAGVNQFAGKCDSEIEEKCFRLGILPEEGVNLEDFKPWTPVEIRPLPMRPGLNPGHSP